MCDATSVTLVWVTGNSGVGKSTVCDLLKNRGELAVDADWDGFSRWVDRTSGQSVTDPPYPVPAGWLERFAWMISRGEVAALAARAHDKTAFLCGSAENETDVWDLFDLVICLVADDATIKHRLETRTSNTFGKHPEEMAAALAQNADAEATYRRLGATIIDATQPPAKVADATLATAAQVAEPSRRRALARLPIRSRDAGSSAPSSWTTPPETRSHRRVGGNRRSRGPR